MRTMKRVAWVGCALALFVVPPVNAQLDCGKCYNNEDGTAHAFGNAGYWYSYMNADCNSYNSCHQDSQSGGCADWHYGCGLAAAMLVQKMNTSIARGEVARVGALIAANPTRVQFDPSTGRVAVRDCDGKALMAWSWQARSGNMDAPRGAHSAKTYTDWRTA